MFLSVLVELCMHGMFTALARFYYADMKMPVTVIFAVLAQ